MIPQIPVPEFAEPTEEEDIESIRRALATMKAGLGRPIGEFFAEIMAKNPGERRTSIVNEPSKPLTDQT